MAVTSRTYPVFTHERKQKRSKRKRRIAVVQDDSAIWHPVAADYFARVRTDGGIIEAQLCVNSAIWKLT